MGAPSNPPAAGRRNPLLPVALLFLIGALWGGFFVLIKIGVTGGVTPLSYLFWFTLGAGSCLYIAGALRGRRPVFPRAHIPYYLKLGFVRFTLANMILYTVQGKVAVGIMAVIMTFVPIFTYTISLAARMERFVWLRSVGILLGFGGVLLIVLPKSSLPDRSLVFWVLLGFGTPLLHAFAYVALSEKTRPQGVDSLTLSSGTLLSASLLSLPIAIATGEFQWLAPPFGVGERALILHFFIAAVNFYAIFELIRIAGPTYMSQANFLSVGFGVLFGMLFFGEQHSVFVWGAIVLILAGVALVNMRRA